MIQKFGLALAAAAACFAFMAPASNAEFGIDAFDGEVTVNAAGDAYTQAAGHPFGAGTVVSFESLPDPLVGERSDGDVRTLAVDLPPGFVGNPALLPTCPRVAFYRNSSVFPGDIPDCPPATQVGMVGIEVLPGTVLTVPIFILDPSPGSPASFGFAYFGIRNTAEARVRSEGDYGLTIASINTSQALPLMAIDFSIWGFPADASHDAERLGGASSAPNVPFITLPTSCAVPGRGLITDVAADSWQEPNIWSRASFESHLPPGASIGNVLPPSEWGPPQGTTGCDKVPFDASTQFTPTSSAAQTPTGLEVAISVPQDGLLDPKGTATAHVKKTTVTLPEGVTINPSSAEGLGVCTSADFARESLDSKPGEGCPEASKLGTVKIDTPVLNEQITGSLYLAAQGDNPFNSLIAMYLVAKHPERGIIVKLAGRVDTDHRTGQITTTFDDLPQLPFERFTLSFREGARAPLVAPSACGTYTTRADFVPWSADDPENPRPAEILHAPSQFQVTSGIGGSACPAGGKPAFRPGLNAGTLNNAAGQFSPFNLRLTRNDGEQEYTHFSIKLPPGLSGKLAGVPFCSEAAIAAAKDPNRSGRTELATPACPAASEVGRTLVGAGVGPVLTYVPGKVYLAGPYNGSALSVVAVTAAVAGPFDLGTVVVRQALRVNPETAEVFIDATGSDPIPHIIDGITVHMRDIRVYVDRPQFTLNPTNCKRTSVASTVLGSGLDFASAADDAPITVTTPFQAADCAALEFKPRLKLSLKGGTKRGQYPSLRAELRMKGFGEAGIRRAQVTLPRSEFLANAHIGTVCTRVQYKADACPKRSIYGHARAFTPLLDEPLEGPVYLRSSENPLPDLVAGLKSGKIEIDLVGRIDSDDGQIRNTFEAVPDAPVSKFVLRMAGGKKGLLENSANLCAKKRRAIVAFDGQNGKSFDSRPVVKPDCKGKKKAKAKRKAKRR